MDTPDRLLRIFLRIAELKSLSKAAEDLDQTQSGVSRQLATLEAQLGKPLFVRTGRGVALTEAGQKLQEALEGPYRAIDQAVDAIRDAHDYLLKPSIVNATFSYWARQTHGIAPLPPA